MYYNIYHYITIGFFVLFGICFLFMLFKIFLHITAILPGRKFPEAKKNHKYAILVPARNESKVIAELLKSIQNQTYDSSLIDTYVIVERDDDPTVEICKQFPNTHVVVRKHLELKGKGYALDEAFQEILSSPHDYEAYFIFDADNVLDKDYMKEMNKVYDSGYEMGLGYRNSKNWNDGWIASCSGLTFSIFDAFANRPRSRCNLGVQVYGTGFYISANFIEKMGGWKFYTFSEDYEFSMYLILNNIKSTYNEKAKFFDEQPTTLSQSWKQRVRWCKGYTQAKKLYSAKLMKAGLKSKGSGRIEKISWAMGVLPLGITLASIIIYQVFNLVYFIIGLSIGSNLWQIPLIALVSSAAALYLFLSIYTAILLICDHKNIKISFKNGLICTLVNPYFMLMYIPIFITASCKKEVQWVTIDHSKSFEAKTN